MIKDHVLLPWARALREVDAMKTRRLTSDIIDRLVQAIPDAWLGEDSAFGEPHVHRVAYMEYLRSRLEPPHGVLE
jgi:hypothetical protein